MFLPQKIINLMIGNVECAYDNIIAFKLFSN